MNSQKDITVDSSPEQKKMSPGIKSQEEEQEICISCGFCCDGTLHASAVLNPGEKESGTLPVKIDRNYFRTEAGEFFHHPCPYFQGKCSIYNKKKPNVCSAYRCKLLNNFSRGRISKEEALKIVSDAKSQRMELRLLAKNIWNEKLNLPFINIWKKLTEYDLELNPEDKNLRVKNLAAKSTIFNILMTKHFKPKSDFNKMVSSPENNETEA